MVLLVKPTPTQFPTNCLYAEMDNTPLHSSVCHLLYAIKVRLHAIKINQIWCLKRGGFFILEEAADAVRSTPRGALCHADVVC